MELQRVPLTLTDTDISRDQARMRALIAVRLERVWAACEPHLEPLVDPDTGERIGRADPRFVEAGLRVLRDLGRLYRVEQPVPQDPEAGKVPVEVRELVARRLEELEARMRAPEEL